MNICAFLVCVLALASLIEPTSVRPGGEVSRSGANLERIEKDADSKVEVEIAQFDSRLRKYYNRILIQPKWEEMLTGGVTAVCKLADLALLVATGDTPPGKHTSSMNHQALKQAIEKSSGVLGKAFNSLSGFLERFDGIVEAMIRRRAKEVLEALIIVNESTKKNLLLMKIEISTNSVQQILNKNLKLITDSSTIFKTFKLLARETNGSLPLGDPNINSVKQLFQEVVENVDLFSNIFGYFGQQLQMEIMMTTTTNSFGRTTLETLLADVVARESWSANLSEKIFETVRFMFANYVILLSTKRLTTGLLNATFAVQHFASKESASIPNLIRIEDQNENAAAKSKNAKLCETNIAELKIVTSKWTTDFGEFVEKYVTKIKRTFGKYLRVQPK